MRSSAGKISGQKPAPPVCSFCGKGEHEVRWLVAGKRAHICDECIRLCTDSIAQGNGLETATGVAVVPDSRSQPN